MLAFLATLGHMATDSSEWFERHAVELEDRACAYCGSSGATHLFVAEDRLYCVPGQFAIVRCEGCGLMRTNPRPTLRSIKAYYPSHYGPYVQTATDPAGRVKAFLRKMADPLDTTIPMMNPGRLLEIGAASGNYLVRMQRLGWDVAGIEMDAASAVRTANRTDASILHEDVGSVSLAPSQFDLICGWMVFEHLHDPVRAFQRCLDWLKPGGWLAFSVPDCGNWQFRTFRSNWYALQVPTHLYHFTAPLLAEILSRSGFQQVSVRWQRSLVDVSNSLALALESLCGTTIGGWARAAVDSLPVRTFAHALGYLAAPLRLTGRLTVWAQKPMKPSDGR